MPAQYNSYPVQCQHSLKSYKQDIFIKLATGKKTLKMHQLPRKRIQYPQFPLSISFRKVFIFFLNGNNISPVEASLFCVPPSPHTPFFLTW